MVTGGMDPFDHEKFLKGEMCPVFFGSAVNNFGVRQLLTNPTLVSYWLCSLEKDFVSLSLSFSSCKRGTMMLTLLGNCEVLRRFLGLI